MSAPAIPDSIRYAIVLVVALLVVHLLPKLPRSRLWLRLSRRPCAVCHMFAEPPILRWEDQVFCSENCRALYEVDPEIRRAVLRDHKPGALRRAWRSSRGFTLARLAAVGMLLLALLDFPYGYYQVLRVVVFGVAGYGAFRAAAVERLGWAWVLGLLAVIYNPILPLHMNRGAWTVLNLAGAGVLLGSVGRSVTEPEPQPAHSAEHN